MDCTSKRNGSLFSLGSVSPSDLPRFLRALRHHAPSRVVVREAAPDPAGLVRPLRGVARWHRGSRYVLRTGRHHALRADPPSEGAGAPGDDRALRAPAPMRGAGGSCATRCAFPATFQGARPRFPISSTMVRSAWATCRARSSKSAMRCRRFFHRPDSVTCSPVEPEKTTFKGERLTVFTLAPALNIGRQGATSKTTRIWRGSRSFVGHGASAR